MKSSNELLDMLKNIKMVVTDFDGTLTDHWKLNFEAYNAIQKLEENGIKVSFISSNNTITMVFLGKYYRISGYVIAESGAVITKDFDIIWSADASNFDRNKIEKIMVSLGFKPFLNELKYIDVSFFKTEKVKDISAKEIYEVLEENGINDIKIFDSRYAVHILPSTAGKDIALKKLLEITGLLPNEIIVIGDGDNDIPMFKVASISAAPANATENLKRYAKIILDYPDGKGFAQLVNLILKAKGLI